MHSRRYSHTLVFSGLVVFATACGGGDDDGMQMPMTNDTSVVFSFSADDLCAANVPQPTDLFRADNLALERSGCTAISDPIEAAIDEVLRDEGEPLASEIAITVDNGDVSIPSITSSISISLTSSTATSTGAALPPLVLLRRTGLSTASDGWEVIGVDAAYANSKLTVLPRDDLASGSFYVLIATSAIQDTNGRSLAPSPIIQLLVGDATIGANAVDGLSAASAATLERERNRLRDVLAVVANGSPAITADSIVSIQGWTTALGPQKAVQVFDEYRAGLASDRFTFSVTDTGNGEIPPADAYPPGTPAEFYENVVAFRSGTIAVPRVLGEDGRIRAGWATDSIETIEVPFSMSIPMTNRMRYPVAILLPGYGRSKQDAREIAKDLGGGPQSAVLAIDLAFHGERSVDLADTRSNNGNPDFNGPDGIADASGDGFFNGNAGRLRDGILANAIEVAHIIETLKDQGAFDANLISPEGRGSQIHLIGHGHSALTAMLAANISPIGTVQLPAGGIGVADLILGGPVGLRNGFLADVPSGVSEGNLDAYLGRLEETVLLAVSPDSIGPSFKRSYIDRNPTKVLLNHGQAPELVPLEARQRLIDAIGLPASNVSRHLGFCDNFFIHRCGQGDFFWVLRAREQIAAFVSSGGQTIRPPASM